MGAVGHGQQLNCGETMGQPAAATAENGSEGGKPEGFINKAEVARRLNKRVRTIDNWMKRGILPYYKLGRSVVFKWSEVEKHLQGNFRVCRLRNR